MQRNRSSRLRQWSRIVLVAAVAGLVGGSGLLLVARLGNTTATAAAPAIATAADVSHAPWYGLKLLPARVAFHEPPTLPSGAPDINAAAGILVDIDSGEILWERNPHLGLPPASTTKIMTALLVLANYSPTQRIQVTADALSQGWDESRMGLKAGETLTVQELLTGMLLVSANDAASALAADTVGSERFVGAMNAEAQALGLRDSHFAGPVGLDAPDHRISAYDEAVIAAVAYQHFGVFRSIVATPGTDLPASADHQDYSLGNINQLLSLYPAAVGIKPGYTGDAGFCLVGMAVRGNHRLISVLLNAPYDYRQSARLLDWGFSTAGLAPLLPPSPSPSPGPTGGAGTASRPLGQ